MTRRNRDGPGRRSPALAPLADHLVSIAQAASDALVQGYADGSHASADGGSKLWAGVAAERPAHEAVALPPVLLNHAVDHLLGIAATMHAEGVVMSTLSLVRPALEGTAAAYYLLTPENDLEERLRRWLNVSLSADVELARLVNEGSRLSEGAITVASRLDAATSAAARTGMTITYERRRPNMPLPRARWVGLRPPSDQARIVDLLDDVGESGGIGKLIHRATSAVAHAEVHGLTMFMVSREAVPAADGLVLTPMGMSGTDMAKWLSPLVWGFRRCVGHAGDYYGWDLDSFNNRMMSALLDWREWIR